METRRATAILLPRERWVLGVKAIPLPPLNNSVEEVLEMHRSKILIIKGLFWSYRAFAAQWPLSPKRDGEEEKTIALLMQYASKILLYKVGFSTNLRYLI
jgi:hypothetical protein